MSSISALAAESCSSSTAGGAALQGRDIEALHAQIDPSWQVSASHHLEREFTFPDFAAALAFTNAIGAIAEQENHHPGLFLAWGSVRVTIWTHSVGGLSRSDFILAAKIDAIA